MPVVSDLPVGAVAGFGSHALVGATYIAVGPGSVASRGLRQSMVSLAPGSLGEVTREEMPGTVLASRLTAPVNRVEGEISVVWLEGSLEAGAAGPADGEAARRARLRYVLFREGRRGTVTYRREPLPAVVASAPATPPQAPPGQVAISARHLAADGLQWWSTGADRYPLFVLKGFDREVFLLDMQRSLPQPLRVGDPPVREPCLWPLNDPYQDVLGFAGTVEAGRVEVLELRRTNDRAHFEWVRVPLPAARAKTPAQG